jgi:hypothetical protein
MRGTISAGVMLLGLATFAVPAHAVITDDTSLSSPGVYYGSGNAGTNFAWTVDNETGLQLGVQTILRYTGPVTPTGNVYNVPLGDTSVGGEQGSAWGFAFSILDTSGPLSTSGLTFSMSITDYLYNSTVTFNPLTQLPDNAGTDGTNTVGGKNGCAGNGTSACAAGTQTGVQNAEALSFTNGLASAFDPNYSAGVNNTWLITLTAFDGSTVVGQASEQINAGSGAVLPEPASMALLGTGLFGLAALRRRRRG